MTMTFEQYQRNYECYECGRAPTMQEYVDWLAEKIGELERVVALNPEERAEYEERKKLWNQPILSKTILEELRFKNVMRPFFKLDDTKGETIK